MSTGAPRVLDLTSGIPGAYAARLLAWAGADVVRGEPAGGDPLRTWRAPGVDDRPGGALHAYLRHDQPVVAAPTLAEALSGATGADVVLVSPTADELDAVARAAVAEPGLVVVSITPYGLAGPWRDRPSTDLTLQADSGALAIRGAPDEVPYQLGGRTGAWLAGAYAAAGALAWWTGRRAGGPGALLDLSLAEVANTASANFMEVFHQIGQGLDAAPTGPPRSLEIPSIERTADGWVGFCTNAPHQFDGFLRMVGRDDLADSGELMLMQSRHARRDEVQAIMDGFLGVRTSAEVLEQAVAHQVPVAPVTDGRTVQDLDQVVARGVLGPLPGTSARAPRRPWLLDGDRGPDPVEPPAPAPAPGPGGSSPGPPWRPRADPPRPVAGGGATAGPLAGLRVLDLTSWWAGPAATGFLAACGADVIHLETPARMDGSRIVGASFPGRETWWELSPFFLAVNAGKRSLVLDLQQDRGHELVLQLLESIDVVVENASPRALDKIGLGWDVVHAANPRTILVRMPAYGLDGPWRERAGFAQNIEQASGLAWLTGPPGTPRIQRGPSDPNGGLHAALGLLEALARRDETGEGSLVEVALFEATLAVAAEGILEWNAYGNLLAGDGNRSPWAAPQGVYAGRGHDEWLAVSVVDDEQWRALAEAIGAPDLAGDPALRDHAGRVAAPDRIDPVLAAWVADRDVAEAAAQLLAVGVPAAVARDPRATVGHPQFEARGYHEAVDHPVAGPLRLPSLPFRLGADRWIRRPAPTFGEHTDEVLAELLGLDDAELAALRADGTTTDRPLGT